MLISVSLVKLVQSLQSFKRHSIQNWTSPWPKGLRSTLSASCYTVTSPFSFLRLAYLKTEQLRDLLVPVTRIGRKPSILLPLHPKFPLSVSILTVWCHQQHLGPLMKTLPHCNLSLPNLFWLNKEIKLRHKQKLHFLEHMEAAITVSSSLFTSKRSGQLFRGLWAGITNYLLLAQDVCRSSSGLLLRLHYQYDAHELISQFRRI